MSEQAQPASADHRKLGRALKLFDSFEEIGPGLPIWLPDGAAIRAVLESYAVEAERRAGYQHVYSPVLAKRELYEQSGHWQHYHDDMFPAMRVGSDDVVLRPMLCPHHVLVYKSESRSYRQLPIQIGEIGGHTATNYLVRSVACRVSVEWRSTTDISSAGRISSKPRSRHPWG